LNAQKKDQDKYDPYIFETNINGQGIEIEIEFHQGPEFYYPLIAAWLEDTSGNYIQTLYVAQSIAKGVFIFGQVKDNRWVRESKRRPAALPYWGHKYGFQAEDGYYLPTLENPVADAYTGATPTTDFILKSKSDSELPQKFKILFEINQSWDWNEYWTNSKFPDDEQYKTSSQPALIYEAIIDLNSGNKEYEMQAIGHSHYSGKDGNLYTDLSTITTALEIVNKIIIRIKK
jgi:hypothetical protein